MTSIREWLRREVVQRNWGEDAQTLVAKLLQFLLLAFIVVPPWACELAGNTATSGSLSPLRPIGPACLSCHGTGKEFSVEWAHGMLAATTFAGRNRKSGMAVLAVSESSPTTPNLSLKPLLKKLTVEFP